MRGYFLRVDSRNTPFASLAQAIEARDACDREKVPAKIYKTEDASTLGTTELPADAIEVLPRESIAA